MHTERDGSQASLFRCPFLQLEVSDPGFTRPNISNPWQAVWLAWSGGCKLLLGTPLPLNSLCCLFVVAPLPLCGNQALKAWRLSEEPRSVRSDLGDNGSL